MLDLNTALSEIEFVAFDTETTGLKPGSRLIEIAGLRFNLEEEIKEFPGQLIHPESPIPPDSIRIHHITDDMVEGQPKAAEVLPKFFEFSDNSLLLAHNARFDLRMIAGELERLEDPWPTLACLDTCGLARIHIPGLVNYRLATVAQHFGLKTEGMHRAFQDSWTVKEIFLRMISLLRLSGKLTSTTTIGEVLTSGTLLHLDNFKPAQN